MIAYLDSSVLLRIVLGHPNRLVEWKAVQRAVASVLVEVECLRTLDRLSLREKFSERDLASRREAVFRLLAEFEIVELGRSLLSRASQPFPTPLSTLDAIHLATALLRKEAGAPDLVMATHDADLALAARACGLAVIGERA